MKNIMMIDYRDANSLIHREEIDDMEFCVRDGYAYFITGGEKRCVPLDLVIQVYIN